MQQECFDPALSQHLEIRDQRRFSAVPAPQRDSSSQRMTSQAQAIKTYAKTVEFLFDFPAFRG